MKTLISLVGFACFALLLLLLSGSADACPRCRAPKAIFVPVPVSVRTTVPVATAQAEVIVQPRTITRTVQEPDRVVREPDQVIPGKTRVVREPDQVIPGKVTVIPGATRQITETVRESAAVVQSADIYSSAVTSSAFVASAAFASPLHVIHHKHRDTVFDHIHQRRQARLHPAMAVLPVVPIPTATFNAALLYSAPVSPAVQLDLYSPPRGFGFRR